MQKLDFEDVRYNSDLGKMLGQHPGAFLMLAGLALAEAAEQQFAIPTNNQQKYLTVVYHARSDTAEWAEVGACDVYSVDDGQRGFGRRGAYHVDDAAYRCLQTALDDRLDRVGG